MNAARLMLFAGLALAGAQAAAHPPGPEPHPTTSVPQPVAPSTLPYGSYRYGGIPPYAIVQERYHDDNRGPCVARGASQETSESTEHGEDATPNTIDWCALEPYVPRHAPQVPAAWWWHRHRAPWRYRGP
jgi:hypothetical protein